MIYTPDEGFYGEDVFTYSVVVAGETQTYDGTVEYRGRTSWIRCREG